MGGRGVPGSWGGLGAGLSAVRAGGDGAVERVEGRGAGTHQQHGRIVCNWGSDALAFGGRAGFRVGSTSLCSGQSRLRGVNDLAVGLKENDFAFGLSLSFDSVFFSSLFDSSPSFFFLTETLE